MKTIRSAFILLLIFISNICFSNENERIIIKRINDPITIDGIINEEAWKQITPFQPVMQIPIFGDQPSEMTEILVAYDENYLYVAGRLYDKEAEKILATSFKRDAGNNSSEWFGFAVDTYNDKENALAFFTTPTGLRWDANIMEGAGGISMSVNWNTFWDVAVTQDDDGWYAEFRVPFSSLRFQDEDGRVTMGFISWRFIARKNERVIYPAIPDNWPVSFYKISRAQEVNFKGIKRTNPIYISAFGVSGRYENHELNSNQTQYLKEVNNKLEAGLDLKYSISSNLTFDATINTDFSQTDVDDQVVSLNRFNVYMPEKRQFFLERSRNFEFKFSSSNQVFYSRRVGVENGQAVRIFGGGRLVGRIGKTDFGFLNLQTGGLDTIPTHNIGVLRLKRKILNNNSYVGLITTSKIGRDGNYNVIYGIDGEIQLKGEDYFKIAVAQSNDSRINNFDISHHALRYQLELERRSSDKFSYQVGYSFVGKDYNPVLGFESWRNYKRIKAIFKYSWLAKEKSKLYRTTFDLFQNTIWNNIDNKVDVFNLASTLNLSSKSGYKYTFRTSYLYEKVRSSYTYLGKVLIPAGDYKYPGVSMSVVSPSASRISTYINLSVGSFYDGNKVSFTVQPTWNVSRYLELVASYQYDQINISTREQSAISHLISFKSLFMMNTKLSLAVIAQYSNIEKLGVSNIRFRYNPKEGNDLYIVYNHGFNIDRTRFHPNLPTTNNWSIALKYVHTFKL